MHKSSSMATLYIVKTFSHLISMVSYLISMVSSKQLSFTTPSKIVVLSKRKLTISRERRASMPLLIQFTVYFHRLEVPYPMHVRGNF